MGESTLRLMFAAGLALVALVLGGMMGRSLPAPSRAPPQAGESENIEKDDPETIRVHVSGMVVAPGVVDVSSDAIVADAIDAAGGLRPGAMADRINLAAPVSDGDQIIVPGPDSDPEPGTDAGSDGVLSLNRATASELEALPGVGPVLAERIVSHRDENGGFEVVEDLLQVPGIGEAKLDAIRDLVRP